MGDRIPELPLLRGLVCVVAVGAAIVSILLLSCCPSPRSNAPDSGIERLDGGPPDACAGISCAAPLSCESLSGECRCFEAVCDVGSTCSDVVLGCTEPASACDGGTQVAFAERDTRLSSAISNVPYEAQVGTACSSPSGSWDFSVQGTLPPGMVLDHTIPGLLDIKGTTDVDGIGVYRFQAIVVDKGNGTSDHTYFEIDVLPKGCPLGDPGCGADGG